MKTLKLLVIQFAILLAGLALIEFVFRVFMPLPVHGGTLLRSSTVSHVRVAQDELRLAAQSRSHPQSIGIL